MLRVYSEQRAQASCEQKDKNTCDDWPITHTRAHIYLFRCAHYSPPANETVLVYQRWTVFASQWNAWTKRWWKWKKYDPINTNNWRLSSPVRISGIWGILFLNCLDTWTNHTWNSSFLNSSSSESLVCCGDATIDNLSLTSFGQRSITATFSIFRVRNARSDFRFTALLLAHVARVRYPWQLLCKRKMEKRILKSVIVWPIQLNAIPSNGEMCEGK